MKKTPLAAALRRAAVTLAVFLSVTLAAAAREPVRIGFLDSGISTKHLDKRQVEAGENLVLPQADTQDRIGHGTAAASLVLGSRELGIAGTCPDAVAVSLVCYDQTPAGLTVRGGGDVLAAAIRSAVDRHHCKILNISMGLSQQYPALREAVAYAEEQGVLIVAAVGNDGLTAPEKTYYPAAYGTVVGVGAADKDEPAGFSQRNGVRVLAQGCGLLTASNRNAAEAVTVSGTSYSCALISGVCAEIWAQEPELTPEQVRQRLYAMAQDIGPEGFDKDSGWGIVAAPGQSLPFLDVAPADWYWSGVRFVWSRGLMTGVSGDRFSPETGLTRGQLAAVLWRLAGKPAASSLPFSDVAADRYDKAAISWAADAEILTGFGPDRFGPDALLTREQAAAALWRYAGRPEAPAEALEGFADKESVSAYAQVPMAWAAETGLLTGSGGRFGPQEAVTRGQLAALLERYCRGTGEA